MSKHHRRRQRQSGFTLMEMLVVVAIISLLAAAAVPQFFSVIKASRLTAAGDALISRIAQAQQTALALNTQVELRIFQFQGDGQAEDGAKFKAIQLVDPLGPAGSGGSVTGGGDSKAGDDGAMSATSIGEVYFLQSGVAFAPSPKFSPLLKDTFQADEKTFNRRGARFASLRFYPDGSFKLVKSAPGSGEGERGAVAMEAGAVTPELKESFLTIADEADLEKGDVPKNFVCIQIDPYTGKARVYRP